MITRAELQLTWLSLLWTLTQGRWFKLAELASLEEDLATTYPEPEYREFSQELLNANWLELGASRWVRISDAGLAAIAWTALPFSCEDPDRPKSIEWNIDRFTRQNGFVNSLNSLTI